GQFAGWLGQSFDPLTIDANPAEADYRVGDFNLPAEISAARLDERRSLLASVDRQIRIQGESAAVAAMDRHYRRSFDLLHSAVGKGAFDLDAEPPEIRR